MTIKSTKAICFWCKHFFVEDGRWVGDRVSCTAFPDGIPTYIWDLRFNHQNPHKDDNGIQFEKMSNYDNIVTTMRTRLTDEQLDRILEQMLEIADLFHQNKAYENYPSHPEGY